jgi:hypothetical protein
VIRVVRQQVTGRPHSRDTGGQARELALQHWQVLIVEVVPDQVHREVPAPWALVSSLELRGDDGRVTGWMMLSASSRSRAVRTVRSETSL